VRLSAARSQPSEGAGEIDAICRAPGVFVILAAAQKVKFVHALANRGADRVVEQLCAGAEPRHLRIEAAEIGIGVAAVLKSVIDAGNGIGDPKPIKAQHSGRAKLSRRRAVKGAHRWVGEHARFTALVPALLMQPK